MKYFIDSEFMDDGKTIDLISIGIISEDGREYYAQVADVNPAKANQWVKDNVFPHLAVCTACEAQTIHSFSGNCAWRTRAAIAREIFSFMDTKHGYPELVGWCCGYDFVAFCQLWGTMMDVPCFIPHYMHEIQVILDERGIPDEALPPIEGTAHNALADAKHIKAIWEWLNKHN